MDKFLETKNRNNKIEYDFARVTKGTRYRKKEFTTDMIEKIKSMQIILYEIGIPIDKTTIRQRERKALSLLALADLKPNSNWEEAKCWDEKDPRTLRSRDIITFINENYFQNISSGSYDDIRRKDLIEATLSGIVINPKKEEGAATNDPSRGYAISPDVIEVFRNFGKKDWKNIVKKYIDDFGKFSDRINLPRNLPKVSVTLPNGKHLKFTQDPHNQLQKQIIEEFVSRYVKNPKLLYVGEPSKKILFKDEKKLNELGFFEIQHDQLPDIIVLDQERGWLFLIEAVISSNPFNSNRKILIENLLKTCNIPIVYVSAFPDKNVFGKFIKDLAWETEVWIVETPEHLIHFDGEKFFGPYEQ